jgi:hypothetical protein
MPAVVGEHTVEERVDSIVDVVWELELVGS